MNEKEKYKEYYSQIKLDDKTSQKIRNAMHSAKRRKNNSLSVHTFNRYASLASCFLVMVFALNSIAGRTYTLPVYHVETTQETSAQETETEIETSDETTEYQYSTEVGDIVTTTVPDELPLEKITVVPDIDDEDEVTDGENDGVTTEPYQESSQTKIGEVTTKRPPVTRPPKNTETTKPTTPTTKPPQSTTTRTTTTKTTQTTTGAVTTATHTHTTTTNQTAPPVVTTAEGTSTSVETTIVFETSVSILNPDYETSKVEVEVTTIQCTDEIPTGTEPCETTASETEIWFTETTWVEETTTFELPVETEPCETTEQYYIHILVAVDKPSNIDLSKVIDEDTYSGIGEYSVISSEIINTNDTNYIVKYVLILSNPTRVNTNTAVAWIRYIPIEGQISVYYSD